EFCYTECSDLLPNTAAVSSAAGDPWPSDNFDQELTRVLFPEPSSFSAANNWISGGQPNAIATADFNGDLRPDLAMVNTNGTASILLASAGGAFTGPTSFGTGSVATSIATADFNGDADPDLAVTKDSGNVNIFVGSTGGSFTRPNPIAGITLPK